MDQLLTPELMPFILGGFGLLLLLLIVAVVVVMRNSGDRDVAERLSEFAGGGAEAQQGMDPRQALEQIDKVVSQSKQGSNTARDLARADVKLTVAEFYLTKLAAAGIGVAVGLYIGRASGTAMIAGAIVGALVFSFFPNMYVNFQAKKRLTAFNNQLGDTITMMANALRGGYSFLQTLDMVSKEAPYPVNVEFRRVVQEVGLGRSTEEALANLQRRVPSEDLDLLITAVNIQMEVGGNLAQILDTIGHTIRERVRIKGEIQTLTAQGRISAWVITGLPIGLAIFISVVNPDYMAPIFSFGMPPEHWCCLPVVSLVMIGIGFVTIMKIMDIEV
ncbi:type II secretion system F family protein [Candidatus Viridilinea mediisalina]|uniref:Secretion system protein n=1 Tax=Candidatus Viridilinea mediisalina TaxID=2024553 RepID=A0A2A6RPI1_9CHLR|nr:type II secretion system F family protein [Candidatus Viridilinea mediisalina]PDW04826.1 secretion system protein [Candidatus Viridilinea mediisalina]